MKRRKNPFFFRFSMPFLSSFRFYPARVEKNNSISSSVDFYEQIGFCLNKILTFREANL